MRRLSVGSLLTELIKTGETILKYKRRAVDSFLRDRQHA